MYRLIFIYLMAHFGNVSAASVSDLTPGDPSWYMEREFAVEYEIVAWLRSAAGWNDYVLVVDARGTVRSIYISKSKRFEDLNLVTPKPPLDSATIPASLARALLERVDRQVKSNPRFGAAERRLEVRERRVNWRLIEAQSPVLAKLDFVSVREAQMELSNGALTVKSVGEPSEISRAAFSGRVAGWISLERPTPGEMETRSLLALVSEAKSSLDLVTLYANFLALRNAAEQIVNKVCAQDLGAASK